MEIARVLIIDDDAFVRSTLTAGFKSFNITVVAAVKSAKEAIDVIKTGSVDVAIVDLDLGPGPNGIDICYSLRKVKPDIGLVLLTSYSDPRIAEPNSPSLPKGCRFLSKSNFEDFRTLVNEVLKVRNKPLAPVNKIRNEPILTATQLEVLKLVAEGLSTAEIAQNRGVSVKAIDAIIARIQSQVNLPKSKSLNQRVLLSRFYSNLAGKKPPGA